MAPSLPYITFVAAIGGGGREGRRGAKEHKVTSCVAALLNIKVSEENEGGAERARDRGPRWRTHF